MALVVVDVARHCDRVVAAGDAAPLAGLAAGLDARQPVPAAQAATDAKVDAIAAAARPQPWDMPKLLAMLTSASKEGREQVKRWTRDMVSIGTTVLAAEKIAGDLASFANRHEP